MLIYADRTKVLSYLGVFSVSRRDRLMYDVLFERVTLRLFIMIPKSYQNEIHIQIISLERQVGITTVSFL